MFFQYQQILVSRDKQTGKPSDCSSEYRQIVGIPAGRAFDGHGLHHFGMLT